MNYGKNQLALLKFLHKYPNQWHRIKRRKAIDAARSLGKGIKAEVYTAIIRGEHGCIGVFLNTKQNG